MNPTRRTLFASSAVLASIVIVALAAPTFGESMQRGYVVSTCPSSTTSSPPPANTTTTSSVLPPLPTSSSTTPSSAPPPPTGNSTDEPCPSGGASGGAGNNTTAGSIKGEASGIPGFSVPAAIVAVGMLTAAVALRKKP